MALELDNKVLAKKSPAEANDIIAGADGVKLIKPTETFVGTILALVINGKGTITEVLAADTLNTDIVAGGATAEGFLNIDGVDLEVGSFINAGRYSKGANFTSVTAGTASVYAYYKYDIDRS